MNECWYSFELFAEAFNSLSRDHRITRLSEFYLMMWKTFNSLSRDHNSRRCSSITLPMPFNSLSRDHIGLSEMANGSTAIGFQLPLSGSRDGARLEGMGSGCRLSTPSLGITFMTCFTTPLSRNICFQLPLSGSPSPIPGFSGSPRLSAAAPLRTNEF